MLDHSAALAAVALGRLGGLKSGIASADALGPKKRFLIATRAAKAPWETVDKAFGRFGVMLEIIQHPQDENDTKGAYPCEVLRVHP